MHSHYQKGLTLFLNRQFKLAETEFRRELTESPDYSSAHAMLSMSMLQQSKVDQALASAKEAVRLAPDLAYGHYALASANYRKGKIEIANREIKEALRLDPNDSFYYARAAEIKIVEGQHKQALQLVDAGLNANPNSLNCLVDRANILVKLDRLDDADKAAEQALVIDPEDAAAHMAKGFVLLHKSQITQSFSHYKEALRLAPNSAEARKGLALTLKARYPFYNRILSASLWLGRLDKRILAASIVILLLSPAKVVPGMIVLILAAGNFLFNLILRFDPLGRSLLTPADIRNANYLIGFNVLVLALILFAGWNESPDHIFNEAEGQTKHGKLIEAAKNFARLRDKADRMTTAQQSQTRLIICQRLARDEEGWSPNESIEDATRVAKILLQNHNYRGAIDTLNLALAKNPQAQSDKVIGTRLLLADCFFALGKSNQAENQYLLALKIIQPQENSHVFANFYEQYAIFLEKTGRQAPPLYKNRLQSTMQP